MDVYECVNEIVEGVVMMICMKVFWKVFGFVWFWYFNKVMVEMMYENIKDVGLLEWSEVD